MKLPPLFSLFALAMNRLTMVIGYRSSMARNNDQQFQMLIAGGKLPENTGITRNLVSIRTRNYIQYHGDNHFCTGVIISSRTILTAAHCVTNRHLTVASTDTLLVVFGTYYRLKVYSKEDTREVKTILVHPEYQRYVKYDVALLRLTQRIPGSLRHINRHSIGKTTFLPGQKCITMGWGQVYPHGPYANEILILEVILMDKKFCDYMKYFDADSNLCTEAVSHGEICPGDMGSPLLCNNILTGILGGAQLCQGHKMIKFGDIKQVTAWIDDVVLSGNRPAPLSVYTIIFNGLIVADILNFHLIFSVLKNVFQCAQFDYLQ